MTRALVVVSTLYTGLTSAGELDAVEQALQAAVSERRDQALSLLAETVNINSGTMNLDGVREVGKRFANEFEAIGFTTQWIDGDPFSRAGHLVARHDGGDTRLLLIGHLDTVFEPDSPFQTFNPKTGKGPGTTDMKGGNVVMLEAIRALQKAGVLDQLSIRAVLTGDEERRGRPLDVATRPLIEAAKWADYAIGFEDGDGNPATAVISRRGSSGWKLTVSGTPAHSSQVFRDDIGYGAIFETARILDAFRTELAGYENLTFNPGVVVGGTTTRFSEEEATVAGFGKNNVIAETAIVTGDLRAVSPQQQEHVRDHMRSIVEESLPGTNAEIVFDDGYPPMAPTDANRLLLRVLDQASRDLGHGPVQAVDPLRAGAADVSFASPHVDAAIDGLGLMGDGGHTVNETADLATLVSQAQRAAVFMYRLSQAEGR